jgi:signal transduction histidine kinase
MGTGLKSRRRAIVLLLPVAFVLAGAAVWITLRADFLAYPGWLAAQKADFILGPVLIGLYWLRVRPASRFGWLLIAFGLLCAGYITQSSSNPWLFGVGLVWESLIYLGTLILILTFPTGRLEGVAARLVIVGGAVVAALNVWLIVMMPQTGAGGAISSCRSTCPENALAFAANPGRALDLIRPFQIAVIGVALATAALLIWRIATGTPPRRRALAFGTSVALLFTVLQITFLSLSVFEVNAPGVHKAIQWAFTGARAMVWYGFLFALIAAQLFAGRVLRRLLAQSLHRPSRAELEGMLRKPLGDPGFQLRFWNSSKGAWGAAVEPGLQCTVTVVEREGRPAVALIHDAQLDDDPELLQAAGAVTLLAAENAELDAAWHDALDDVERSRERMVHAVDNERRRVAENLHDGLQQRLSAIRLRLAATARGANNAEVGERLDLLGQHVEDAIEEVREVSRGLYPHLLFERGLIAALEQAVSPVPIRHDDVGRHAAELESAVYYCCLEAVQNATKHGAPGVTIRVSLHEDSGALSFEVADDGHGFDPSESHEGMGLLSMGDRLAAVGGTLTIKSTPGDGTVVAGSVPLRHRS